MSKGSKQRPRQVSKDDFDNNWDQIFGKKSEKILIPVIKNVEPLSLHDQLDKESSSGLEEISG